METVKQKIEKAQAIDSANETVVARLKAKLHENNLPPEKRAKIERALREAARMNREEAEGLRNGQGADHGK